MPIVCEKRRAPKRLFAKGSFRWTDKRRGKRGRYRHLVACRRGYWDRGAERCDVSTEIYATVLWTDAKRCPRGYRRK